MEQAALDIFVFLLFRRRPQAIKERLVAVPRSRVEHQRQYVGSDRLRIVQPGECQKDFPA